MKRFQIDFEIENADFDDKEAGILRIVSDIKEAIEIHSQLNGIIKDINGNHIGQWGLIYD